MPAASAAPSAIERLAGETEIVVASLTNLSSQLELLDQKVDALDARLGRETADLRAQIDRAVSGLETNLALLESASGAATSAVAQTGLTWLGVLGAVILGGFIVRACH